MRRSDSGLHNGGVTLLHPIHPGRRSPLAAWAVSTAVLLLAQPARADDSVRDHERARAAVQAGQVLPLPVLLQRLQRSHPGQVLEVELEHDDGRWVYELRLLQPGGRLLKLELDAATGAVLKARERGAPRAPAPEAGAKAP